LPAIRVTKASVYIRVTAEQNDESPEDSYRIPGIKQRKRDVDRFVESVNSMIDKDDTWGWCQVTITAHFGPFNGKAHLGGCSYESEQDFVENSSYYDQMVAEAIEEVQQEINAAYEMIHVEA
jgi:hypothetical protein